MSHATQHTRVPSRLFSILGLVLVLGTCQALAAEDIAGDWDMTMDFGGRSSFATLSITRQADGTLAGKWGRDALSNVKFDGQKLTFTRTVRFGDNEFTLDYAGTLKDGKLTGALSSDQGEFGANGVRVKPKPPAVGVWDLAYKLGDRDVTAKLTVSEKADGSLDAKWAGVIGESMISNVKLQGGKLTFDRTVKFNDREFKMAFEGTAQGDKLTGVSKSDMGETEIAGTRFGAALIGKWEMTANTDQGPMPSALTVYPDLTGRQEFFGGEMPIKDLKLDGDQVAYALELSFGDQTFKIDYKLKLQGNTFTGQSSSERGSFEITGRKLQAPVASPLVGKWEFTRETQQGTRTNTLTVKPDMTATYSMRDNEVPVTDLKVDGDQVSFKVTMTFNDQQFTTEFKGKLEAGTLKGEMTSPRGTREAVGKRVQ
ncbi:MAG TPA: hypothetical protein PKH24_09785 [Sedimentisphaerales bacterium]|jgi:hypothetical protein|nr:hypothetical protein [Sedimentisphaerales bacterium]HNU28785.1 hypothetical protein [Sedimentisphaerales bacterium]